MPTSAPNRADSSWTARELSSVGGEAIHGQEIEADRFALPFDARLADDWSSLTFARGHCIQYGMIVYRMISGLVDAANLENIGWRSLI